MKYKLVPVKPTREMWAAAGDAVVTLNSQHHDAISSAVYKAMLAAAPVFEHRPVGYADQEDLDWGGDTVIRKDPRHSYTIPLYRHPQPAPEVAKLLDALTPQVLDWMRCGLAANGRLRDGDHPALAKLRTAIASCRGEQNALEDQRKQGGEQ